MYAFAQNREVCCGAVGKAQAAKIRQVYALAEQNGAPVVGLFDSDGAKLGEGLDAMDALAEILLISNRISGVVPQIAVVAGACVGSAALVAANADITVAVDGADYYLKPDEKGSAAVAAADVDEAIDKVRGLLALLPSNNLTAAPRMILMMRRWRRPRTLLRQWKRSRMPVRPCACLLANAARRYSAAWAA